jgi:hypothetical protein
VQQGSCANWVAASFLFIGILGAPTPSAAVELVLDSDPPGLTATLDGTISLSGRTPLSAGALPPGGYELSVQGLGVADAKGRLKLLTGGKLEVRPWGGAIALALPPGFVHFHRNQARRGLLFLAGGTLSAIEIAAKNSDVNDASDDVAAATTAYNQAVSEEAISLASTALTVSNQALQDAEELRAEWAVYFALTWAGAALEAWKLTASPTLKSSKDGRYTLAVPKVSGGQAALWSALVPGSGQRYVGRYDKGNFFTLAVMGFGAGTLFAHEAFLKARLEQQQAQLLYDSAETTEEILSRGRTLLDAADNTNDKELVQWIMLGATGVSYLWNIIDAYSLGNESARLAPVNMAIVPTLDGAQAAFTWRLP